MVYKIASVPSVRPSDINGGSLGRVLPRQTSTGSTRGTQTVGYGNTKIDGSNNVITVGDTILLDGGNGVITTKNTDGSTLGLGTIPGSNPKRFGFFSLDTAGNLVMEIINGTMFVYNPTDSYHNVTQGGLLPDGSGGFAVAKPGTDVVDIF